MASGYDVRLQRWLLRRSSSGKQRQLTERVRSITLSAVNCLSHLAFLCKHATKLRILSEGSSVGLFAVALRTKIMALHAKTVEILVEKARFEPKVALGIAEAIEFSMTQAEFVTVPILDARLHEVRAEIRVLEGKLDANYAKVEAKLAQMEAKLVRWVFLVMLGNVALSVAATTVLNAFKTL